jgi:hypothetical protein
MFGTLHDRRRAVVVGTALLATLATAAPAGASVAVRPDKTASFDDRVSRIVDVGKTAYVGGAFLHATDAGATVARSRLAAINTVTGHLTSFSPAMNGTVYAMAAAGGVLYVGGTFTKIGTVTRNRLAAFDLATGRLLSTFAPKVSAAVRTIAVGASGTVYIGGEFSTVDGVGRSRLAAVSPAGVLKPWAPVADARVRSLLSSGNRVYVVGAFRTLNGSASAAYASALDPVSGAVDPSFNPSLTYSASDIAVTSSAVYVAADGPGGHLRAFGVTGHALWNLTTDGGVQAVTVQDGEIYFGGHFDNVCLSANTGANGTCLDGKVSRRKLGSAALDGRLTSWNTGANSALGVFTLASSPTTPAVDAGGAFTAFASGTISQRYFARFG